MVSTGNDRFRDRETVAKRADLLTEDRNGARGIDSESYLMFIEFDDDDADLVAESDRFACFSAQYEHGGVSHDWACEVTEKG